MRCLAVLPLLACATLAGRDPLPYAKTPKEAVEMARTRGKLIFITVCVDNDEENRAVIKNVLHNRKWQKIAREFVLIYANKDDDHGSVMVKTEDGKREKRDADVPELTNRQVQNFAFNYVAAFYPPEAGGVYKTPLHFIVDANEEVVDIITNGDWKMGFNHVPADTVIQRMQTALKMHGRGISEKQYEEMQKHLVDAKAARARDNVKLEIAHLRKVTELPKKLADVETAQARLDEIEKAGRTKLQEIEGLIRESLWVNAIEGLEAVQEEFEGLPVAEAAEDREKEIRKDKRVRYVLKARELYREGLEYLENGREDLAAKRFAQCIERGGRTKYAELSKKELEKLAGE